MFFRWVIGEVGLRRFPVNTELASQAAVTHPIDPHVSPLEALRFHSFADDPAGSSVVGFDRRRSLWMAHAREGLAKDSCFTSV